MVKELIQNIEILQGLMVAYVTNGRKEEQPKEYKTLYLKVRFALEKMDYSDPNNYRTLEAFWGFCKMKFSSYAERRAYIEEIYNDVLIDLHRKLENKPEPKKWGATNELLSDNLEPIRKQWLKAKNFLLSNKPDFENCIKEATNSIESALQILLEEPGLTLGKTIKKTDIDNDIKKIISQMYGLVSNKDFVRHGGTENQDIDFYDAEFFLEFAGISIKYLKDKIKNAI